MTAVAVVPPRVSCEDCGKALEPNDHVRIPLFRKVPGAPAGKRANAGGRRWREYDLCRRCGGEALRRRAMHGTVTEGGKKRALRTRERIPPTKGGRPRLLTDEQLRAAHVVYTRGGLSMRAVAERLKEAGAAGTVGGLASALLLGWRRLKLPVRPRGKAMALARFGTDGTKSKPQKRRCEATVALGDRRGKQCRLWAQRGSRFCWDHRGRDTHAQQTPSRH